MSASRHRSDPTRVVRVSHQALGWVLVACMLFTNLVGAWHGVAHASPAGVGVATSMANSPSVNAADASWLDALFAYHMRGQGHADCLSFDHLTQAHGLPGAAVNLPLLALAEAWRASLPALPRGAWAARSFDARAPPVLA
jgi:hypothetical protein